MKRKLLTLLTLLLCAVGGAWGDTTYKITFNGSNAQTVENYFSWNTEKHNFNTKFTGCTYDNVEYTSGLKMEGSTSVSWITTNTSTVTIVQSDWESSNVAHGTPKTIKFDGTELAVAGAQSITGGKVYTISNVAAGNHSMTRGSGESGVFAITVVEAAATAPTITTNLSATADAYVGEAKTFSIVASGATSYQWYKCDDANKTNATAIQGATSASYSYTATAAGTEYIYCDATNTIGTTTSTVCAITATAPDYIPVTFGLTRSLYIDTNDPTKGTMGANNWLTADNRFTLTEVYGSDVLIDGGSRTYNIDNVAYTATYSFKKQTNTSSFDNDHWFGYSFTIPENKALDITQVDARLSDASNATWTWKIQVEDANGNSLWNTSNKSTTGNSTTTVSISDNSLQTALAGLTPGATYYAKIYYYQAGTTKCASIDLTFNGKLVNPQAAEPIITLASAANAMVGVSTTLTPKVTAYPEVTAYQWYQCDDANKTNPQAVENATTEALTFTPAATGTLYYYLTATNSVGTTTSDVCTVTVKEPDLNLTVQVNNQSGTMLTSEEYAAQNTDISFGVNINNERVAVDATSAVMTVSGKYHSDHGMTNAVFTVKVPSKVKISVGECTYSTSTITVKNSNNETVASATPEAACWKNSPSNVAVLYYGGDATTLTISGMSYCPYIAIESVEELPAQYTATFMNGSTTVGTITVYAGSALGTLPTPEFDNTTKRFRGYYTGSDGWGTKATTATVPTANITYYASIMDIPTQTAGYYVVSDGLSLLNAMEYASEVSTSSNPAKIFMPNGTYDWGTAAETQLTGSHISIIGESLDGTILSTIPAQEGLGEGTLLYNKGQYNYLQDLTLHNNYPYGNSTGRAASLKDEGNYTICKNVWLYSHQDTYYSHKSGGYFYFNGGKISGCVDYMCGQSRVYYDGVTLSNDNRTTYMTANSELYVFNNCTVENGGSTYYFGRAWGSVNGGPVCVFLNTTLKDNGSKLGSTRWLEANMNTTYVTAGEYGTMNADGTDITPASNEVQFTYSENNQTKNGNKLNTILTAEQAATYTMAYTLGDWAATAASDVEQATVTDVTLSNNTLSWTGTSDAYLIEKDGEFVALTTATTYDTSSAGMGTFTVRAANTRGGFGEAVEAETGGDAVKLTWTLATGTNATALSSTQTSTSDILNSATMTAISASTNDQAGKDNLTVKLNCGTAEAAAATVTFTVPSGFAFIPHKTTAKVQPITYNAYVKLDVNGTATTATSFTQGQITTATLTESTERMLTGTVTIGIYVYDGASTGVTTYRLGSPITISGELVATVSTLAGRNYGTCVTGCGLDFTNVTDAKAYIATGLNSAQTAVVLQQVNKVAANTPLIIYTEEKTNAATVRVPITTDDPDAAVESSLLVAGDGTTQWDGTSGYTYYYIASDQFHKATSGTLQSGKAYLKIDNGTNGARLGFVFADEATSISNVNRETITNNRYYDLQGRRIDSSRLNPGVYIKDGRKVVVK